jgi:hypothetical protein
MRAACEKPKILVCCYHKSGTHLFRGVLTKICRALGLTLRCELGTIQFLDPAADVTLLCHSLVGFDVSKYQLRGIRVVRDPREIWVSGYFYHRSCSEAWCINKNFAPQHPLGFPQIPYSQLQRSELWKLEYLRGLEGRSYQENLLVRREREGLEFEGARYAQWTAEAMSSWRTVESIRDVQLEGIMSRFDATMSEIFSYLGFSGSELDTAVQVSRSEDVSRWADSRRKNTLHGFSKSPRWPQYLARDQVDCFHANHASLIESLGYVI